jgi:hypothetical protein
MGEIRHEGGRLINGPKWSGRADEAYLHVLIFKEELEGRAKNEVLDGGGKRTPSPLNLPPTSY